MSELLNLVKFEQEYNKAIQSICSYLEPTDCEPPMHELVRWMLDTDINPYSYLQKNMASYAQTAEGFKTLLGLIYHALYDDGDIEFVSVDGEPRIVFANRWDDNFRDIVLSQQEKNMEKRPVFGEIKPIEILALDIEPKDFGVLCDKYHEQGIKKCFIIDAARFGVEYAKDCYSGYKCWNDNWIKDCESEIMAIRNRRIIAGVQSE